MKQRLARWRGIIPLFLLLVLLGVGYVLFADRIARDTVEEKVLELQQSKRDLADAVLAADAVGLRHLEREDLELLLRENRHSEFHCFGEL